MKRKPASSAAARPPLPAVLAGLIAALPAPAVLAQYGCDRMILEADAALVQEVERHYDVLAIDLNARWELIDRLLRPRFDFAFAAGLILDITRNEISDEQLQRFSNAFFHFLLYNFGHLATEYEDDTLRLLGDCRRAIRPWGDAYIQSVRLELTGRRPETIDIEIIMHQVDDEFRIFDIQHEGTSQIKYYRGQFVERLTNDGIEALTDWLEEEAVRQRELRHGREASDARGGPPDD